MSSVPVWTLNQILDPAFREEIIKHACELHGHVQMQFTDGTIEVSVRMGLLNLFWLDVPAQFGIPVAKRHFIKRFVCNNGGLMKNWNRYYDEILALDSSNASKLKKVLWDRLELLYKFCSLDILSYAQTLDILDMADIFNHPPVAKIVATHNDITPELGTRVVEKMIEVNSKKLMDLIGTKDAIPNNALYVYSKSKQLNPYQFPQMVYAYGPRTDIDDTIVRMPVRGSALDGLQNSIEFLVESLSAKKSSFYNKVSVSDSQYFGRKQHLVASAIVHRYTEDCGSTTYVGFNVHERNWSSIIGKYILQGEGANAKLVLCTRDLAQTLIGQRIQMRSPATCKHTDGVCDICGGAIMRNIEPTSTVGILCALQMIEPTTQKLLSSKHLIKTSSMYYVLPSQTKDWLVKKNANEIYLHPGRSSTLNRYMIGFDVKDITRVHDVIYLDSTRNIKEELFSDIKHVYFRNTATGETEDYDLTIGNLPEQVLYLSSEFLLHFKAVYPKCINENGERIWIPLKGADKSPIFGFIVINDNMRIFVKRINSFLSSDIKNYTSYSDALQAFSDIVNDKVEVNIMHLEVVLKAYLTTSKTNFSIPLVTDPEHVTFGTCASILTNRAIGTKLAYQSLNQYLCTSSTYLAVKSPSVFDVLLGYY